MGDKLRTVLAVLATILLLFLLWFGGHVAWMLYDGLTDEAVKTDVGIILGNQVLESGKPSGRLQARLDKAVVLYKNSLIKQVIVSGGLGVEGHQEAVVMGQYIRKMGVDPDDIIVDLDGYSTWETALNTTAFAAKKKFQSFTVITNYYHIQRTKLAFSKMGLNPVYGAHADFFEWRDLYAIGREFFAYYGYLLRSAPESLKQINAERRLD